MFQILELSNEIFLYSCLSLPFAGMVNSELSPRLQCYLSLCLSSSVTIQGKMTFAYFIHFHSKNLNISVMNGNTAVLLQQRFIQ